MAGPARTLPATDAPVRVSYADYLALERESDVKHSWWDGHMVAMTGGTPAHALIGATVSRLIGNGTAGGPCLTYSSDLRVRTPDRLATYADVTVVCGPVEPHPEDPDAATNPTVLVEVLSPSTEATDRGAKLLRYKGMASVQHLLLMATTFQWVQHHRRLDARTWRVTDHFAGGAVELDAIGVTLDVAEVYTGADVPVPMPPGQDEVRPGDAEADEAGEAGGEAGGQDGAG